MKLKELEHKIRQVRSLTSSIREAKEAADILEKLSAPVSVTVTSVYCLIPIHSAVIMLRAEEKRLKEVRTAVMVEIGLEEDDDPLK
jgi:hypothetical protein